MGQPVQVMGGLEAPPRMMMGEPSVTVAPLPPGTTDWQGKIAVPNDPAFEIRGDVQVIDGDVL